MRAWISSICVLLFSLSCSSPPSHRTRLLLDWWPNPVHVPLFVGKERGFFQKRGIDLEIMKHVDPAHSISYLGSESADLAIYDLPHTLRAQERWGGLQVVGTLIDCPLRSFLFRKDNDIHSPQDFSGKVFGNNPVGLLYRCVQRVLQEQNVQFGVVKKLNMHPLAALLSKHVDVISVFWNVEAEQMRVRGVEPAFFKITDFGIPSYDEVIVIARKDFLDEDPTFTTRFRESLAESIAWMRAHPSEAFDIYLQLHPDKGAKTRLWEARSYALTLPLFSERQTPDLEKWRAFCRWMQAHGLLSPDVDVAELARQ